ncbi:hypothetical protein C9W97_26185, partial [Salmonella enterica subsp. enterica serovar Enteritidis]|nr:hypothetical protein [Salmonella enterica subsp. enterica serovar Enteritidis]
MHGPGNASAQAEEPLGLAGDHDAFRPGHAGARQRGLHLSRRAFLARRLRNGGVLRRDHLF